MTIELLGDNCKKCRLLQKNIALALAGYPATVEVLKIHEPGRFAEYGLLSLPGIAVNGELKTSGKLLATSEIIKLLEATCAS